MDSECFGKFIAQLRKEKHWTQADLAKQIGVTDKAISRWERGLVFPDINTIAPLAKALDVSIVEIMESQRIVKPEVPTEVASKALDDMVTLVQYHRDIERRNIIIVFTTVIACVCGIFLADIVPIEFFLLMIIPAICFFLGIVFSIMSIYRANRKLTYQKTLFLGIAFLLIPILAIAFLVISFVIGLGPVPA